MSGRAFNKKPATYQDLVELPENLIGEILDGELIASPRPTADHSGIMGDLYAELRDPFGRGRGGPGGWWFRVEPELHLSSDVLVPDVCGWRHERMPARPAAAYIALAPDWVCEILSPSTERYDRFRKLNLYAKHGVQYLWLIDPRLRAIEVYALRSGTFSRVQGFEGEDPVRAQPFDAIELKLNDIFGAPPQPGEGSTGQ